MMAADRGCSFLRELHIFKEAASASPPSRCLALRH